MFVGQVFRLRGDKLGICKSVTATPRHVEGKKQAFLTLAPRPIGPGYIRPSRCDGEDVTQAMNCRAKYLGGVSLIVVVGQVLRLRCAALKMTKCMG